MCVKMTGQASAPVKLAAKCGADREEAVVCVSAVGASVHDHAPSGCHTCVSVTGRGLRAHAAHAMPPEGGCVEQVQVAEECTLHNHSAQVCACTCAMFMWRLLESNRA